MDWRFVDSDLAESAFTMAADEAMALARSVEMVPNTLHLYRRKRPTVSLGYFQRVNNAIDMAFCVANGIQVLRRASGGSAVYTDRGQLIYGLVLDQASAPGGRGMVMEKACSAIVLGLEELGIGASFKPVNDVLVGKRKISGSAQMRRWGIVLQHGTLIMSYSRGMMLGALKLNRDKLRSRGLEPENHLTSVEEALGHEPDISMVKAALLNGFGKAFDANIRKGEFTAFERDKIQELVEIKYGQDSWNLRL